MGINNPSDVSYIMSLMSEVGVPHPESLEAAQDDFDRVQMQVNKLTAPGPVSLGDRSEASVKVAVEAAVFAESAKAARQKLTQANQAYIVSAKREAVPEMASVLLSAFLDYAERYRQLQGEHGSLAGRPYDTLSVDEFTARRLLDSTAEMVEKRATALAAVVKEYGPDYFASVIPALTDPRGKTLYDALPGVDRYGMTAVDGLKVVDVAPVLKLVTMIEPEPASSFEELLSRAKMVTTAARKREREFLKLEDVVCGE